MTKAANVQEHVDHWKAKERYTHDEILYRRKTYDRATELEREEGDSRGCEHAEGGPRDNERELVRLPRLGLIYSPLRHRPLGAAVQATGSACLSSGADALLSCPARTSDIY